MLSMNNIRVNAGKLAAVSGAMLLPASRSVYAVDPALSDVATTFATYVTAILTFAVSVIGAFTLAALVPMGLKKLIKYAGKLFGKA